MQKWLHLNNYYKTKRELNIFLTIKDSLYNILKKGKNININNTFLKQSSLPILTYI
jgi:hypothetical protein